MPGQVYSVSTYGGNTSQPYLSQRIRTVAQPLFKFRQFIDAKEAIGMNKGDTFLFDKRKNVDTQGGTLVETATIPETQYVTVQGTCVITEYGNAIPFTGKLEDLSQFQIEPLSEQALRDDMVKVLESAAGTQFSGTDFICVMTATNSTIFTTNGTATASAAADLTGSNVRDVVNFMLKKLIPLYDGQNYMCVASVQALAGIFSDVGTGGWVDVSKYTAEYAKNIFNGEVGSYYMTRFVRETGFLSNAIGSSTSHGQAVFFGADAVYEAVAQPEQIRTKIPQDFGRDQGLAWYALLGFKRVWDFTNDGEQHIVYVTSA